jgi:CubicO group peptidase (beta-lactamase class C family)
MISDWRRALGSVCLFTLAATLGPAAAVAETLVPLRAQPEGVPWPTAQWPQGALPAGVSQAAMDQWLSVTASPHPLLGETRAVVVIAGGKLVAERYMAGYSAETPLISWSMAKSITHAMVGVAVRKGLVEIDKPMGNPRWAAGDPRAAIPWRLWMNMVDGQNYHEIDAPDPVKNDAARMLYGPGRLDVAAFAASLPLAHAPGTQWNYNSAGVNLIADALGRVFAPDAGPAARRTQMRQTLARELFEPLGMTSAVPEFDAAGTFLGSALVYATARDFARFGLLYARDGMWNGQRILPPGWVDFARTRTSAKNGEYYGAGWWLTPEAGRIKLPRDVFSAQGHEGQLITVVPSKDLVIVRLGRFKDQIGFPALRDWMAELIPLFPDL